MPGREASRGGAYAAAAARRVRVLLEAYTFMICNVDLVHHSVLTYSVGFQELDIVFTAGILRRRCDVMLLNN